MMAADSFADHLARFQAEHNTLMQDTARTVHETRAFLRETKERLATTREQIVRAKAELEDSWHVLGIVPPQER